MIKKKVDLKINDIDKLLDEFKLVDRRKKEKIIKTVVILMLSIIFYSLLIHLFGWSLTVLTIFIGHWLLNLEIDKK